MNLSHRLTEAISTLLDDFVDPREAYLGDGDEFWLPLVAGDGRSQVTAAVLSETQLRDVRHQCRRLAVTNEFAINGHENRISYVVGTGHSYHAVVRKGADAPDGIVERVQAVLDSFLHENKWQQRQQEIVRWLDRDGECFLRFFEAEGTTRVRFAEPDQIATPPGRESDPASALGVQTEPHDVESVLGYWIDGQLVDASHVQHRKANVDANVRRGLPLFFAVRKNLRRAEKLLRNMTVVAEIQSAIALIRRHKAATQSGIEQFVAAQATAAQTSSATGRTRWLSQYQPGTILDAPAGLEYDFPTHGLDASSFVEVLKAELRSIAARLVMPEFMFTSDASNANYASTLVAEGPALKMFERLQATLISDDREVMWRVLENAVSAGRLPTNLRDLVELQITPPSLLVRDQSKEAEVERIAHAAGILSPQTWSQRLGLDYDQEQKNFAMHGEDKRRESRDKSQRTQASD